MSVLYPWQLLLVTLAGWINRQQHDVIAYIHSILLSAGGVARMGREFTNSLV